MVRRKLVEDVENFDFESIRLKQLFSVVVEETITFLASVGVLKNEMKCDKCGSEMSIQKRSQVADGIQVNSF